AITMVASTATKKYGTAIDPALAVTVGVGRLATGDVLADVSGTLLDIRGEMVGSYDILLGSDGSKASNYDITFETDNDAFTITRRSVERRVGKEGKEHGTATDPTMSAKTVEVSPGTCDVEAEVASTVGGSVSVTVA